MATGRISIYHPNQKCTGSAFQVEVSGPKVDENNQPIEGRVFFYFAPQRTVGAIENGKRIPPTFNWGDKVIIRLTIFEVAQIIEVFRGVKEKLVDGSGLFHRTSKGSATLTLEHQKDPYEGYWLNITKNPVEGESQKIGIFITPTEAFTLGMALYGAMPKIAFGI